MQHNKQNQSNDICKISNLLYEQGNYSAALENLRIAATDEMPNVLNNLAYYLYKNAAKTNKIYDESISLLKRGIKNNPQNVKSFSLLGKIYVEQHDYTNARSILEKAVALDNNISDINNLVIAYYYCGNKSEATSIIIKALQHEFVNDIAYYNFALLCTCFDIDCFKQCISNIKNDDDIDDIDIAYLYYTNHNYQLVYDTLSDKLDMYSPNIKLFSIYAFSLKTLGKSEELRKFISSVISNIDEIIDEYDDEIAISKYNNIKTQIISEYTNIISGKAPDIALLFYNSERCYLYNCVIHHE